MIKEFVDRFMAGKPKLEEVFSKGHPGGYSDIVKAVVEVIRDVENNYSTPDPERIHEIDDGDYQGTLVYVIGDTGYQPYHYWYVKVGYGSCSGCDTLNGIRDYDYGDVPTPEQVKEYLGLALHIVQGLKKMGD